MIKDYLDELKQEQQHKKAFIEELSYSTEYMDWLDGFTSQKGNFATDSFLYDRKNLSDKDLEYVNDIQILFEEISAYCSANYIDPSKDTYEVYYSIKNNNVGYHIGMNYGQGTSFYCQRLESPDEEAIDFKHIRSGVKLPKTIRDEFELEKLTALIENLYQSGVSINAIAVATDKAINSIKMENDNKSKKSK